MVCILYKFSKSKQSKSKQRMTEQTRPKTILTRSLYANARYQYFIMPHILEGWLNGGECCDPAAVKMYLTELRYAKWGMLFSRLSRDNQEKCSAGMKLFQEWDARTAYKVPELVWSCTALTRHIKFPWESRYALMDEAELDEAENAVFERWCKTMSVEDEEEEEEEEYEDVDEYEEEEEEEMRTHVRPVCSIKSYKALPRCDDFAHIGSMPELVESVDVTATDMLVNGDVFSYCKLCHQARLFFGEGCERLLGMVVRTTPTSIVATEICMTYVAPCSCGCGTASVHGEMDVHINYTATPTTMDIAQFGLCGIEKITNITYDKQFEMGTEDSH